MVYPQGNENCANEIPLNPDLFTQLLVGASTLEQALSVLDKVGGAGDIVSFNMLTKEPRSIVQGTWVREVAATELYGGHFTNKGGPSANGDGFRVGVNLPSAGVYRMRFNAPKNANAGIVQVFVDLVDVSAGGVDLYAAALDALNIVDIAGLALPAGAHTVTFLLNGQNALSGGFDFYASGFALLRTA